MKNKLLAFFLIFSCGQANALPQDWPCKTFMLERLKDIKNEDVGIYRGQDNDYALEVNIFWQANTSSDDCGTAGCDGIIKNLKTNQEENLRFFCEAENNHTNAKCTIKTGEEYILQKVSSEYYQVNLCDNTFYKYVNTNECSGCTCILHNSGEQGKNPDFYMGCKKNKDSLHCMTGNTYVEKYYPKNKVEDFKNCVGLTSFGKVF